MEDSVKNRDEIKDQLDKMLNHSLFKGARRSCSFLRYVTEKTLCGESYQIKEFSIAVDAFGLEPTFDQQIDPRIRVEAKRLRDRLKLYYEGPGKEDPIIINMEKGSYIPCFRLRGSDGDPDDSSDIRKSEKAGVLIDGSIMLNISFENDAVSREHSSSVFHFQSLLLNYIFENRGSSDGGNSLADLVRLQKESLPVNLDLRFHTLDGLVSMGVRISLKSPAVLLQCRQSSPDLSNRNTIRTEAAREAEQILEHCRSMKS